jgi:hypothetical protein
MYVVWLFDRKRNNMLDETSHIHLSIYIHRYRAGSPLHEIRTLPKTYHSDTQIALAIGNRVINQIGIFRYLRGLVDQ